MDPNLQPVSSVVIVPTLSPSASISATSSPGPNSTTSGFLSTSSFASTSTVGLPNMGYVGVAAASLAGGEPNNVTTSNIILTDITGDILRSSTSVQSSTSLLPPPLSIPLASSVSQIILPTSSARPSSTVQDVTFVIASSFSSRSSVATSFTTNAAPAAFTSLTSSQKPQVQSQYTPKSISSSKSDVALTYSSPAPPLSTTQPFTWSTTTSPTTTFPWSISKVSTRPAALVQTASSISKHSTTDVIIAPTTISTADTAPSSTPISSSTDANATATYVSAGVTLTGQAAVAALAAAGTSGVDSASAEVGGTTSANGGESLSSCAIIGIVAGIIGAFVIIWVIWYFWRRRRAQKAMSDEQEEYHSGGREIEEKEYDENGKTARSSFDDGGQNPFGEEEEGRYQEWYDDGQHEYTEQGHDYIEGEARAGRERQEYEDYERDDRYNDNDQQRHHPDDEEDIDYDDDDPHDGTLTAYADNLETSRMTAYPTRHISTRPKSIENPFEPDMPVPPALARTSSSSRNLTHRPVSRPNTDHSLPASVNYGEIYGDYEQDEGSRPETRFDPGLQTASPETPATSTLLPWLSNEDAAQPPPKAYVGDTIPGPSKGRQGGQGIQQGAYQAYEREPYSRAVRPGPPRAVMAQTPAPGVDKGWQGVIPTFRS